MRRKKPSGLLAILAATAIAGAAGYLLQLLVPFWLKDSTDYVQFTVFWSTVFLFVSVISGLQQEVARATTATDYQSKTVDMPLAIEARNTWSVVAKLTFATIFVVSVIVIGLVLISGNLLFSENKWPFAGAMILAVIGYTMVAAQSGIFYGIEEFGFAAVTTVLDAVLRFATVVLPFLAGLGLLLGIYGIVVPFLLTAILMWAFTRGRVKQRYRLDAPFGALMRNSTHAMLAACATGLLISGLPTVLKLTTGAIGESTLAAIILALTITRAPLVVPVLALQSYLVISYRKLMGRALRRALVLLAGTVAVTVLLSVATWAFGTAAVTALYGPTMALGSLHMTLIVLSGGITAGLCVVAPALLARGLHKRYLASWVVAAVVTVIALLIVGQTATGAILAIMAGPLVASIVAVGMLWRSNHQEDAIPSVEVTTT